MTNSDVSDTKWLAECLSRVADAFRWTTLISGPVHAEILIAEADAVCQRAAAELRDDVLSEFVRLAEHEGSRCTAELREVRAEAGGFGDLIAAGNLRNLLTDHCRKVWDQTPVEVRKSAANLGRALMRITLLLDELQLPTSAFGPLCKERLREFMDATVPLTVLSVSCGECIEWSRRSAEFTSDARRLRKIGQPELLSLIEHARMGQARNADPETHGVSQSDLLSVRKAIAKHGPTLQSDIMIQTIGGQKARVTLALRVLERLGEYRGFRRKSTRNQSAKVQDVIVALQLGGGRDF